MKTTKIDWTINGAPKNCYINNSILFSWLTIPQKNVFPQVSGWHSCRESFATEICRALGVGKWSYSRKLNLRRMRFAVIRKYNIKATNSAKETNYDIKWMKNAKRILNIFEKYLGWGLTTVYITDSESVGKNVNANVFVFLGSVKWMRSPQLISLYLLILRLSRHNHFQKIKSMDDLNKWVEKTRTNKYQDVVYLKTVYPYLFSILDNVEYLFFKRSMKENFTKQDGYNGINCMLNGISDNVTTARFNKIKEKVK